MREIIQSKKVLYMSIRRNSARDIPVWEDLFDKPLPSEPTRSSSFRINKADNRTAKQRRFAKARNQARGFLGSRGCQTNRIRGVRQLNYLLSICFGVDIDWEAKPKPELVRAIGIITDMGPKGRRRKMRAAQKRGHPAIEAFWDPDRLPK
jgi:hypothetical protein